MDKILSARSEICSKEISILDIGLISYLSLADMDIGTACITGTVIHKVMNVT